MRRASCLLLPHVPLPAFSAVLFRGLAHLAPGANATGRAPVPMPMARPAAKPCAADLGKPSSGLGLAAPEPCVGDALSPLKEAGMDETIARPLTREEMQAMRRAARDEESVTRRFWKALRRVAANTPFAEDLVAVYF